MFLKNYTVYEIVLFEKVNCKLLHNNVGSYSTGFRRSSSYPSSQQSQERYKNVFQDVNN